MLCYYNKIDVKFTNVSLTSYVKLTLINKYKIIARKQVTLL